jgi:membrane-associated protease RseP (regulator of RpoE activity)
MNKNVGKIDRWIRIILGIAILSLLVFLNGSIKWIGLIGLIPLLTGLLNYCPIYALLGISTDKKK